MVIQFILSFKFYILMNKKYHLNNIFNDILQSNVFIMCQNCMQLKINQAISTNQVLLLKPYVFIKNPVNDQRQKQYGTVSENIYYLPAYIRIKVKKLTDLQFGTKTGKMNVQINFTVFYGGFIDLVIKQSNYLSQDCQTQQEFLNPLKQLAKTIILVPNDDDPIELDQLDSDIQINRRKRTINAQIKKQITSRLIFDIFWTPFQIVSQILTIKLKNTVLIYKNCEYKVKFNFMKNVQILSMLSYCYEGSYEDYQMAEKLIKVQCSQYSLPQDERNLLNIRKPNRIKTLKNNFNVQVQETKDEAMEQLISNVINTQIGYPQNFNYAHFTIPLYKYPVPTLSTIFVPIWILNLINIGIYFSAPDLSDRLSSVATLMIAYVALIPTVRSRIPANAKPTFVEILVYFQAFISMLSVIQGIDLVDQPGKKFIWYQDFYFLTALVTASFSFFSIILLYLVHKFYWEPNYNKISEQNSLKFDRKRWQNPQCDTEFLPFKDRMQLIQDKMDMILYKKSVSHQHKIRLQRLNSSFDIDKSVSLTQKLLVQNDL